MNKLYEWYSLPSFNHFCLPSRQVVFGRVHKRCQKWSVHCAATAVWPQQRLAVLNLTRHRGHSMHESSRISFLCVPDGSVLRIKFLLSVFPKKDMLRPKNKVDTCQDVSCLLCVTCACLRRSRWSAGLENITGWSCAGSSFSNGMSLLSIRACAPTFCTPFVLSVLFFSQLFCEGTGL